MKVILTQDVPHLGEKNSLQEVKNGYANNYLIPQGFAIVASRANQKMAEENDRQAAYKRKRLKEQAEAIAQKIQDTHFVLAVKATKSGKIFGSVTPLQLAQLLKKHDITLPAKNITFPEPIKEIGKDYEAQILVGQGIETPLKFQVQAAQ